VQPNLPPLPLGLYDLVLDRLLEEQLAALGQDRVQTESEALDPGDGYAALADHLHRAVREVLQGLTGPERLRAQVGLCNRVVAVLQDTAGAHLAGRALPVGARRLLSVRQAESSARPAPERPDTPPGSGCLLTGTRLDPSLVSQLRKELQTADRVDILCSFIKWSGTRILEEALRAFTERPGARLRVITTSYLGATDMKAVELLRALPGAEVRVSYDTRRTRLHAKAYLLHRATGFGCAYVGSANLSHAALTEGLEWTVKVSQYESPHLWDRVTATFETYWNDPEFAPYDEGQRPRLRAALAQERAGPGTGEQAFLFELRPYAFQQEILDRLDAERHVQGRDRHLVVAATGTGKTLIAAFDYRQWGRGATGPGEPRPRLLFVAHREELLQQSLAAFRAVLRDANFGDLLVGGRRPEGSDHLFVSIQSYNSQKLAEQLPPDHFAYVVVDEFHHAAAPSYERLLAHVRPRVLLGLTATPERSDGLDVLGHFGGHLSAQIRLPDAINRKLLCPFQYFGVTDTEDLRSLQWQRGGYRTDELDRIYTGNDLRAALVIDKVREILLDPQRARGLGFCVSVAHARYMAARFSQAGIPADCLSGESDREHRTEVQGRLRRREINFLFVVDLYNEGIDIPEIDTVLFLRPTESLTVFLQQLGRGLRLDDGKDCLTVLDFIGQAHRSFRFDLRYRALLADPLLPVAEQVEHGFSHLPAGCAIQMERVARQYVLENIRQTLRQARPTLVREIASLARALGRPPLLGEFLEHQDLEPEEVYRRNVCFARLCVEAAIRPEFADPEETALTRGLHRVQHINSAEHIRTLLGLLERTEVPGPDAALAAADERRLLMLDLCLWGRDRVPASSGESLQLLRANPVLRAELLELLRYRLNCVDEVSQPLDVPFLCPLTPHALYTRDEILAALGHWTRTERKEMREGVLHLPAIRADVFLFTLNKTERHFSPSTMYQDYAINEHLFHWQSQSTTSPESPTGQRYIGHRELGYTVLLFGREDRKAGDLSAPFSFLGPARYVGHTGSRPMSITWRLEQPLPAKLLRRMARLAVG
jgi:superfamily II DNA or RNA helicase/HKD family nuclease